MYRVIIIEDDPMVASINRQYVDRNPQFRTVGVFRNGQEGLKFIKKNGQVDLVLLDYYVPMMNGLEFLEALRNMAGIARQPEIIMVTAANAAETVQRLMGAGIRDYLVKPFEYARFEQALRLFAEYREMLDKPKSQLGQKEIDQLLRGKGVKETGPDRIQKGMQEHTLETIRQYMKANPEHFFTSEEIAEKVHLSRVTIRRYVNYMLENKEIVSEVNYQTGGRPSIRYRYVRE